MTTLAPTPARAQDMFAFVYALHHGTEDAQALADGLWAIIDRAMRTWLPATLEASYPDHARALRALPPLGLATSQHARRVARATLHVVGDGGPMAALTYDVAVALFTVDDLVRGKGPAVRNVHLRLREITNVFLACAAVAERAGVPATELP